jgi:hypothetical protein
MSDHLIVAGGAFGSCWLPCTLCVLRNDVWFLFLMMCYSKRGCNCVCTHFWRSLRPNSWTVWKSFLCCLLPTRFYDDTFLKFLCIFWILDFEKTVRGWSCSMRQFKVLLIYLTYIQGVSNQNKCTCNSLLCNFHSVFSKWYAKGIPQTWKSEKMLSVKILSFYSVCNL